MILYGVFMVRLARRLKKTHFDEWQSLGRPMLWTGGALSTIKLTAWISAKGYLNLKDSQTTVLATQCRRVYLAMISVAIWVLIVVGIGPRWIQCESGQLV